MPAAEGSASSHDREIPNSATQGPTFSLVTPDLQRLLRDTSRSFYLTLRVLPGTVRLQIGLAYLLARATDTIADTELVPVADRLQALRALRGRIEGNREERLDLAPLVAAQPHQGPPAERKLLGQIESVLQWLPTQSPADQCDIRAVLATITSGQELDLQRFGKTTGKTPVALGSDAELDDYTYRVAGCVGEFWTRLTRRHVFPRERLDEACFLADGIRFGQGLQLVNILRDLPRDLRTGRCYLPGPALTELGLKPADLLDPATEPRLRPLYDSWLAKAAGHLEAGWRYTESVPANQRRLRLACAWPLLIGARTLAKLRAGPVLDPGQRLKISRREVRSLILGSLWRLPFRDAWAGQFRRASSKQ